MIIFSIIDSHDSSLLLYIIMEDLDYVFSFPKEKMVTFCEYMHEQMLAGLSGSDSDLRMLPSFVTSLATGD